MTKTARFVALGVFAAIFSFAQSWSGTLVDSDCYQIYERNLTQKDPEATLDRDLEVRECAPKAKTKFFGVVQHSGQMFKLDSVGNAKVAELMSNLKKKARIHVSVTGEMIKDTVKVDSIVTNR
jgi:hypothetical protein